FRPALHCLKELLAASCDCVSVLVVLVCVDVERIWWRACRRCGRRSARFWRRRGRRLAVGGVAVGRREEAVEGLAVAVDSHAFVVTYEKAAGFRRHQHVERSGVVGRGAEVKGCSARRSRWAACDSDVSGDWPYVGTEIWVAKAVVVDTNLAQRVDLDSRRESGTIFRQVDFLRRRPGTCQAASN